MTNEDVTPGPTPDRRDERENKFPLHQRPPFLLILYYLCLTLLMTPRFEIQTVLTQFAFAPTSPFSSSQTFLWMTPKPQIFIFCGL